MKLSPSESTLQSFLDGQNRRLIINLPPSSLKSRAATICLPAHVFRTLAAQTNCEDTEIHPKGMIHCDVERG